MSNDIPKVHQLAGLAEMSQDTLMEEIPTTYRTKESQSRNAQAAVRSRNGKSNEPTKLNNQTFSNTKKNFGPYQSIFSDSRGEKQFKAMQHRIEQAKINSPRRDIKKNYKSGNKLYLSSNVDEKINEDQLRYLSIQNQSNYGNETTGRYATSYKEEDPIKTTQTGSTSLPQIRGLQIPHEN